MPRPKTKDELLAAIDKERGALEQLLSTLSAAQMTGFGVVEHWSVKDVLAHLIEWEQMCLSWYEAGKSGVTPKTPAEGFTWREIPALNQQIYEKHKDRPLDEILEQFDASHRQILAAVQAMSEEELFTPKYYTWTKSTTLGSYMVSATSSHYLWARKHIRKGLKAR